MSTNPTLPDFSNPKTPYRQADEKRIFNNDVEKVVALFEFEGVFSYGFICRCLAIRTKKGYVPKKNTVGLEQFHPEIAFYLAQVKECAVHKLNEIYGDDWESFIEIDA